MRAVTYFGLGYIGGGEVGADISLLRGFETNQGCGENCNMCVGWWKNGNYCDDNGVKSRGEHQVCGCGSNELTVTAAQCDASFPGNHGVCPINKRYAFYPGNDEEVCGGDRPQDRPGCQFKDGCTPGCNQCVSNLECYGGMYGFEDTGLCCDPPNNYCGYEEGHSYPILPPFNYGGGNSLYEVTTEGWLDWTDVAPQCFQNAAAPKKTVTPPQVPIKGAWIQTSSTEYTSTNTNERTKMITKANAKAIENGFTASVTLTAGPASVSGGYSHTGTNTKTYSVAYTGESIGTTTKTIQACPTGHKEYRWFLTFPNGDKLETLERVCIPDEVVDKHEDAAPRCPGHFCGCDSCECCTATILQDSPGFPTDLVCKDDNDATFIDGGKAICKWNTAR